MKPHARKQFFFAPHEIDIIRTSLTFLHERMNSGPWGPDALCATRFTQRQLNEVLKHFNPFIAVATKKDAA